MAGAVSRVLLSVTGLAAVVAGWALVHAVYGPLVLPRPAEAARELLRLIANGEAERAMSATLFHSLAGWSVGCAIGLALALLGGLWEPAGLALRPVATAFLGLPPVAWLVLAALWFGANGFDAGFTVAVVVAPVVFVAAIHGLDRRDPRFDEMAAGFCAPPWQKFTDILAPQIFAHFLPAAATALGMALKVCVMSEVMASGTGIGGQLAAARSNLDLVAAMAWILLVVALALILDLALIEPFRRLFQLAPAQPGPEPC
jgi:NitT/TauT family transport system permease protein